MTRATPAADSASSCFGGLWEQADDPAGRWLAKQLGAVGPDRVAQPLRAAAQVGAVGTDENGRHNRESDRVAASLSARRDDPFAARDDILECRKRGVVFVGKTRRPP